MSRKCRWCSMRMRRSKSRRRGGLHRKLCASCEKKLKEEQKVEQAAKLLKLDGRPPFFQPPRVRFIGNPRAPNIQQIPRRKA